MSSFRILTGLCLVPGFSFHFGFFPPICSHLVGLQAQLGELDSLTQHNSTLSLLWLQTSWLQARGENLESICLMEAEELAACPSQLVKPNTYPLGGEAGAGGCFLPCDLLHWFGVMSMSVLGWRAEMPSVLFLPAYLKCFKRHI